MSQLRWVCTDEEYSWQVDHGPEESEAFRYDNGQTLRETYPEQYKQIPHELFERFKAARELLKGIQGEIDAYEQPR